jgi:16S rRNA C1402 N4-methylase RsmH
LALNEVSRLMPADVEVQANPRARSAVMRVAQRTPAMMEVCA